MSGAPATAKHWRRAVDDDGICWLTLDKAGATANTLSGDVLDELDAELDAVGAARVRGLVFESGKRSGFILGADVKEFAGLRDAEWIQTGCGSRWMSRWASQAPFSRASSTMPLPPRFSMRRR